MASDRDNGKNAYLREDEVVSHFRRIQQNGELTPQQYQQHLGELADHYERLVNESKLLTSVGDRLQRKLKAANSLLKEQSQEIQNMNESLVATNYELQTTIDQLTRARASRKAQTYILGIAVSLFVLSELLETQIESWVQQNVTSMEYQAFLVALSIKVLLVFFFKPMESFLERYFLRQMSKREAAAQAETKQSGNPTNSSPSSTGAGKNSAQGHSIKSGATTSPAKRSKTKQNSELELA